jgi:predicted dehydrogenase
MTVSIAIVGAGGIARDHADAYRRIPDARVAYVADVDAARARALAQSLDAAWTTDVQSVLAALDVDAIDICTPSETHAPLTIAAAAQGKAIHVEKPAALSLEDFDAMAAAVEQHGVTLMVGQTARFQPVNMDISRELAAGTIGRLRALHVTWYAGHVWEGGWRAWQLDPVRSGGHPVHNGIHALDLAIWLFGQPVTRVFARGTPTFAPEMGIPDTFHMTARMADGGLAVLEISYALKERGESLRRILAVGEQGSLHHSSEEDPRLASDAGRIASPAIADAMHHQLVHWVATLHGEAAPIVTLAQVRAALAAAFGAQRSLETGAAIDLTAVAA